MGDWVDEHVVQELASHPVGALGANVGATMMAVQGEPSADEDHAIASGENLGLE